MRQLISVLKSSLLGICLVFALGSMPACSTAPVERFSNIKENMTKDDVLEIVGSPKRTERIDGKEKWAYRYWTGDDKDTETLKQVTFINGKVVSAGDDTEEINRLKEIQLSDEKKAAKRREKSAASEPWPPHHRATESDFTEMKGSQGPVGKDERAE